MTTSTDNIPVFREHCAFKYLNNFGDVVSTFGLAYYFDDFTLLIHTGASTVRDDLLAQDIVELSYGGDLFRVRHLTPAADGCPRFKIPRGYSFFY